MYDVTSSDDVTVVALSKGSLTLFVQAIEGGRTPWYLTVQRIRARQSASAMDSSALGSASVSIE